MTNSDRLASFRASYRDGLRRWLILLLAVVAAGFLSVAALILWRPPAGPGNGAAGSETATLREHAALLAGKRLYQPALRLYDEYLARAVLPDAKRASVLLQMGELAQKDRQFETALAYLYRAKALGLGEQSEVDANRGIAQCLEQLGRAVDLRRELRAAAPGAESPSSSDGAVLARVGNEVITERDLEYEIAALPASIQPEMRAPERREELVRDIVARRLLREKALRAGLGDDPAIQEELTRLRDALLVRALIEREVTERVNVTPGDVRRFYAANRERFTRPASARVRIGTAETREAALQDGAASAREVVIQAGRMPEGPPFSEDVVDSILTHEPGETAGPYQAGGLWHAIRVISKQPEEALPFERVREQAESMYRRVKEQEQAQALVDEAMQAEHVEIFTESAGSGKEAAS